MSDNTPKITRAPEHFPLAERLQDWHGQPYELTNEDKAWLNMELVGEEGW